MSELRSLPSVDRLAAELDAAHPVAVAAARAVIDERRAELRAGARGEGKWRKATWEEALDYTAAGLRRVREKHGPQGVLFSSSEAFQERFFRTFAQAFGSSQIAAHGVATDRE